MPWPLPPKSVPYGGSSAPVVRRRAGDTITISLRGTLDTRALLEFEQALKGADESDAAQIVVDVDELLSLDARELQMILKANRRSARNGHRLRITPGKGHVADIFRLAALDQALQFDGDLTGAVE